MDADTDKTDLDKTENMPIYLKTEPKTKTTIRRSTRRKTASKRISEDINGNGNNVADKYQNSSNVDKDATKNNKSSDDTTLYGNTIQLKKPYQMNNSMNESLSKILKELNLYEELYDFMIAKEITPEALKYMKLRHIDELFNGSSLNLKIIFEQRLAEWQDRNDQESSIKISHKSCPGEKCQLLTLKYSNGTTSSYHMDGHNDFRNLSNRFIEVIRNGLNTVLRDYKTYPEHCNNSDNENEEEEPDSSDSEPSTTVPMKAVAMQKNTENINMNDVENIVPKCGQSTDTESLEFDLMVQLSKPENGPIDIELTDELVQKNGCLETKKPSQQIINSEMLKPSPHTNKRKWGLETEVREILLMYKPGNFILKYYQNFKTLTDKLRTDLVHIIVDHFIAYNEFMSIALCRSLAEQIAERFPTERAETYFYQENKSYSPKGKLWYLYQNERRWQKQAGYGEYTKSNRLKMESLCAHLKNMKNEKVLLKKWKKTFGYRRFQLQKEHFSNWKLYFDEYPFCKQPSYSLFIDSDLEKLYPDLKFDEQLWEDFLNNFQIYFWNRIKHKKSKELYEKLMSMDEPSDYFPIAIMQLLHAVFNNNPNLEDAQRHFTVEVSDLVELKEIVIDRKKYCLENDMQCKPYIAVVRENNTYVHYSVILDSTGFGCDNYKESLILCFKLYLFFDISYPPESLSVWLFIQKYFFNGLSSIYDLTVDAFIQDIQSQSKVKLKVMECN